MWTQFLFTREEFVKISFFVYWKTVHGWVVICCIELLYKRLLFILVSNNKFSNLYCHQQVRTRWFGQSIEASTFELLNQLWYNMGNCLCKRKREPKRYFSLKTFQLFFTAVLQWLSVKLCVAMLQCVYIWIHLLAKRKRIFGYTYKFIFLIQALINYVFFIPILGQDNFYNV